MKDKSQRPKELVKAIYPKAFRRKRIEIAALDTVGVYYTHEICVPPGIRVIGTGFRPVDAWTAAHLHIMAEQLYEVLK